MGNANHHHNASSFYLKASKSSSRLNRHGSKDEEHHEADRAKPGRSRAPTPPSATTTPVPPPEPIIPKRHVPMPPPPRLVAPKSNSHPAPPTLRDVSLSQEFIHLPKSIASAPPPRNEIVREAWYNTSYLNLAHLGHLDSSLICPTCRREIPSPEEVNVKFVFCSKCETKWPLVVARMTSLQRGNTERWVRDESKDKLLGWARILTEEEEVRLFNFLNDFSVLPKEELISRLCALKSNGFDSEQSEAELALHLTVITTWQLREFNHVAFCRKFLPTGLLDWQPACESHLDTLSDLKGFKISPEEICLVRKRSLSKRLEWLKTHITLLRQKNDNQPQLTIKVRRNCVLEDASTCFMTIGPKELWRKCRYEFVDEPAFDAGGVAREFFSLVAAQVFDPQLGLFEPVHASDGLLSYRINLNSGLANELHLQYFRFLGRVMAKALIDGYTMPCHFTREIYKHLVGEPIGLSDLNLVDPQLAKSLLEISEAGTSVNDLCLDFTTGVWDMGLTMTQVELVKDGANIPVTSENVDKFLSLMLRFVMLDRHHLQLSFLLKGFEEVVPVTLLSIFTAKEFEGVLSGLDKVDVLDWKKHTHYRGKYLKHGENHEVIDWFWTFVAELNEEDRGKLLQFATGSARVPVQGFQALQGDDGRELLFSIESVSLTQSRYPCAHTCFNRLDLPLYKTREDLVKYVGEVLEIGVTGFNLE